MVRNITNKEKSQAKKTATGERKQGSDEQYSLLADLVTMPEHKEILFGAFSEQITSAKREALWKSIAEILNAVDGGAKKTAEQWRRTLQNQKRAAKEKLAEAVAETTRTGGGQNMCKPLSETQLKFQSLIAAESIHGISNVEESFVDINSQPAAHSEANNEGNVRNETMEQTTVKVSSALPSTSQQQLKLIAETETLAERTGQKRKFQSGFTNDRKRSRSIRPPTSKIDQLMEVLITANEKQDQRDKLAYEQKEERLKFEREKFEFEKKIKLMQLQNQQNAPATLITG